MSKYARKAFRLLPELDKPRILDVGCGSGVPTLALAKLSKGEVVGLDIDQSLLDELNRKIEVEGLSNHARVPSGVNGQRRSRTQKTSTHQQSIELKSRARA